MNPLKDNLATIVMYHTNKHVMNTTFPFKLMAAKFTVYFTVENARLCHLNCHTGSVGVSSFTITHPPVRLSLDAFRHAPPPRCGYRRAFYRNETHGLAPGRGKSSR
jgi:hypothetical protein